MLCAVVGVWGMINGTTSRRSSVQPRWYRFGSNLPVGVLESGDPRRICGLDLSCAFDAVGEIDSLTVDKLMAAEPQQGGRGIEAEVPLKVRRLCYVESRLRRLLSDLWKCRSAAAVQGEPP